MKNWKTTLSGIGTIFIALYTAWKTYDTTGQLPDLEPLIAQLVLGIGLLSAKDGNATGGTKPITEEAKDRV